MSEKYEKDQSKPRRGKLTVGSLFAGIGGLELGLERAGMQVRWQVENDPYCIRVLEKHWPKVRRYGDVRQVDWREVEPVDLICGGFPCQPVSVAGARRGDKDERWLWPEFLRAIREVRPKYALVENVPGLLSIDDGRLARRMFGDLAEVRYDAEWDIISAADVGAPHLRRRIFIVGYPASNGFPSAEKSGSLIADGLDDSKGQEQACESEGTGESGNSKAMAYPHELRRRKEPVCFRWGEDSSVSRDDGESQSMADTECEGCLSGHSPQTRSSARYSGWEQQWAVEPDVGRVAHGVSSRVDRLRCLGNAVVPQVAEYIGRLIIEAEKRERVK